MFRISRTALLLLFVIAPPVAGQSVEDALGRYSGANAQGFLGPLGDVVGATMNSGWTRSARIDGGFRFRLSLIVAGASIGEDRRTFRATTEDGFVPETTTDAPTVFGSTETVAVTGAGGTTYRFPGGIDAKLLGIVLPQLTIGTFAGTEVSLRWFGMDLDDELGSVSLTGFGARHSLSRYLPGSPVDLAVGAYWQSFKLGDAVDISALAAMVNASRTSGVFTVFGGLGFERASTDIAYSQEGVEERVVISLDGANSIRVSAGVALRIPGVEVFADYSLASQSAFTFGLGFGR